MRALRARWIAWMTAVAVLLSMSVTARAPYFCHMMNRVVATCCCDAGEKHDDESACAVRVRATDCCERLSTATRSPTLKASASDLSVPPATLAVAVLAPSYVFARPTVTAMLPERARGPPIIGPPLFIVNCSLLT
ncbi:MAG TPA: hypothetical protein VH062_36715 [Polyangiaceae bacterium]|jgi:hypothetical protein|nr:hypothetical protein [Polyangiaceae bacterium]